MRDRTSVGHMMTDVCAEFNDVRLRMNKALVITTRTTTFVAIGLETSFWVKQVYNSNVRSRCGPKNAYFISIR